MVGLPSTLSSHPSLIGVVRFPLCNYTTEAVRIPTILKVSGNYMSVLQEVDMATNITSDTLTSEGINIPKTSITDYYPYTYYVLTDGECEPLILYPQYMNTPCVIKGIFALSNQPIERYYVNGYKGDYYGRVYNITNLNQMLLPRATNEGISYLNANANTIMQNRKSQVTNNILSGVSAVSSVASGLLNPLNTFNAITGVVNGISEVVSGINNVKETDARNKDISLTPNTISSFGTPSTRNKFGTNNVKLIRFTVKENVKTKINDYCSRYGNKYNNYAAINLKSYKGYIKFIEPDVDSVIDNMYINKISSILERGIFIE